MKKQNTHSRIVKVVVSFFVVLIVCTWISRFTKSVLTPIVESQAPIRMSLQHTISKKGRLLYKKEKPVYIYAGILVDEVFVSLGQNVKKGDALVQYNMEELDQEYQKKEIELQELKNTSAMTWERLEKRKIMSEITQTEDAVMELKSLIENNGIYCAQIDGSIQELDQKAGTYALETAAFVIGEKGEGFVVNINVSEEEQKYISEDDTVSVMAQEEQEEFPIDAMFYDDLQDAYTIKICIKGNQYYVGEYVDVEIAHNSKDYDTCMVLGALRSDGNGNSYVLIEKEKDTILGKELVTEKVNVKIEDSNQEYVAVSSNTLSSDDKVIFSSNKNIEPGDVVREE